MDPSDSNHVSSAPEANSEMKLLLWNVEWTEHPACSGMVNSVARDEAPNVVCLTEATPILAAEDSQVVASEGDYGYPNPGNRHKVWMRSDSEWTEIDRVGSPALPPGRFASGVTGGIRIVGVCIPWHNAHVSTGNRNRAQWQDHRTYLAALKPILEGYLRGEYPVCVVGDFNQRVPPAAYNRSVYSELVDAFAPGFRIHTAGELDVDDRPLIDHVATTSDLAFTLVKTLSRTTREGAEVSDHPGLLGVIERSAPPSGQSTKSTLPEP